MLLVIRSRNIVPSYTKALGFDQCVHRLIQTSPDRHGHHRWMYTAAYRVDNPCRQDVACAAYRSLSCIYHAGNIVAFHSRHGGLFGHTPRFLHLNATHPCQNAVCMTSGWEHMTSGWEQYCAERSVNCISIHPPNQVQTAMADQGRNQGVLASHWFIDGSALLH